MRWLNAVLIIYAILMLAGGIYGFAAKSSLPSLLSSSAAAILVFVGVFFTRSNQAVGYSICAVVALALALFFASRVAQGHMMPGLPALVASAVVLGCLAFGHLFSR